MPGSAPTQLPAYIQLRYEENGVFDRLQSAGKEAADRTKANFNAAFKETETVVSGAVKRISSMFSGLDLGLGDMRQQQIQIQQYRDALLTVGNAAEQLARETDDTTVATNNYIRALRAQATEAQRVLDANQQQIDSYQRLQGAVDAARVRPSIDTRTPVQRAVAGDASIDRAAVSGTTLEQVLGRVTRSATQSSAAMQEAARQQQEYARATNEAVAAAQSEQAAIQAQAQNLQFLSALEAAEADAKARQAREANEATAANINFVEALERAKVASQQAAQAEEQFAANLELVKRSIDPTRVAQQNLDAELARAEQAFERGAISANEYGVAVNNAADKYAVMVQGAQQGTTATKSVINSQRALNVAMLQSGQQLQDIGISLYSGQRAAVVFAQQLPQLAFALSSLEGSANKTQNQIGKFATFLSGPWGLAVGVAVGVLGTMIARLFDSGDAADKAKKGQETFADSLDRTKHSLDEVIQAVHDYNLAQAKANETTVDSAIAATQAAAANLKEAISIREKTKALLESAQSQMDSPRNAEEAAGASVEALLIQRQLNQQTDELARLTKDAQDAMTGLAGAVANINADPITRIKTGFDQLRKEARASIKDYDQLTARLTQLNVQQAAAVKKMQEAGRASKSSGLFGNEITSAQAQSIAKAAGFTVTSANRTRAEQQRLYDTVRTSSNPVALPGTSAHEKGNALDIAFGAGVTPASIKKAFADEGVKLTKLLKEDGHFHIEWSTSGADKAQREAEQLARKQQELADWGKQQAETVQRINEQWDEQPRLVDRANQATRTLDKIISEVSEAQPPNFEATIASAQQAKIVIQDGLLRPFKDMLRDTDRRLQVQTLLAAGQENEADAIQEVWRFQDQIGDLTAEQVKLIKDTVLYEKQRTAELQRQQGLFNAQIDALNEAKQSLTSFLSGRGNNPLKDFQQTLKDLQGKRMFDSLFGDVFDQIEKELRGQSPLGKESQYLADEMSVLNNAFEDLANTVKNTAGVFGGTSIGGVAANDNSVLGFDNDQYQDALAQLRASNGTESGAGSVIEVIGKRPFDLSSKTNADMAEKLSIAITTPFQKILTEVLGTRFGQMLGGVLQEGVKGYLTGGKTGGIIGTLKGLVDKTGAFGGENGEVSGYLGMAGKGAAMGTFTDSLLKGIGAKSSKTGAQLGGAAGALFFGPLGGAIGSVAGGLIGGLFKGNTSASAHVSQAGVTVAGKDTGNYETALGLGSSVQSGISNIIKQLGGTAGNYNVAIGTRGDEYRVNTTGTSLKLDKGAISFGDDEEAAIEYAIMDAINDGAVQGIRESTKNILKAGDDLDDALQDALDWEGIFKELKQYKDPIGAALDDLNEEFQRYIDLADQAGASAEERNQIEELYGIKRNEIIKEQAEQLIGSLQSLYNDLTTGDNGLSLRDRRANALGTYNDLAARVAAGDTTAYDDYADAAQNLLDIERQLYGSQSEYFDRLNEITALTKSEIDRQNNAVSAAEDSASPFDSTGAVKSSVDTQTTVIDSQLTAVNDNLGTVISLLTNLGDSGTTPSRLNFASNY